MVGRNPRALPARDRRSVYVLGSGWVSAVGVGSGDVRAVGPADNAWAIPEFDLRVLVPTLDSRGLDPASRYLVGAAAKALADAGIVVRGALRERAGLFVGTVATSATSTTEFRRSIEERGLSHLSATAFSRLVLNAAAGVCSQALSLRAPTTTVTIGPGSGLLALLYAAEALSLERSADVMVAGGFDEPHVSSAARGATQGAACVILASPTGAENSLRPPSVRAAGWAMGAPGQFATTAARAMERAVVSAGDVDGFFLDKHACAVWQTPAGASSWFATGATAADSLFATAAAFDALLCGRTSVALVGTDEGTCASLALVLTLDEKSRNETSEDSHEDSHEQN
jgi:3-oxoacyl-[acyl-carrier-protein] synthase II